MCFPSLRSPHYPPNAGIGTAENRVSRKKFVHTARKWVVLPPRRVRPATDVPAPRQAVGDSYSRLGTGTAIAGYPLVSGRFRALARKLLEYDRNRHTFLGKAMNRILAYTFVAIATVSAAFPSVAANTPCSLSGSMTSADLAGASTGDATFAQSPNAAQDSDACNFSDLGSGGNTNGALLGTAFSAFGSGNFSRIGKIGDPADPAFLGMNFTLGGTGFGNGSTSGTWTLSWTGGPKALDLVLAIHAADRTTSWLFDNESLTSNNNGGGTWTIEWHNNGGNVPGFSNLTAWARLGNTEPCTIDCNPEPCTGQCNPDIPEPGTIALLGAGALIAGGRRYLKSRKTA